MHIRNSSFKALAQSNGWTDVSELELQVCAGPLVSALTCASVPSAQLVVVLGD